MIRLGQHRSMPRRRLIGEDGWAWIKQSADAVGLVIFMIGAFVLAQHAADAAAWLRSIHVGLVAGSHIVMVR
ncbi:MAG TPA: hypothetical protein VGH23_16350 [Rhizomicrobium sp.]|jgi:hypothetical protein